MIHSTILLAVEEAATESSLFDFDATLPLMAVQFLVLAAILNQIFYKPLGNAIDSRADYIRQNKLSAKERLSKAESLAKQYELELAETRKESQQLIINAQAEAQKIAAQEMAAAQQEAQKIREAAYQEIEQNKIEAQRSLDKQVDSISRQILDKLLGAGMIG
ncbi:MULTISPECIES: F0F1 ATP synthase subunit B' [Oscillatoriales]|jgi:F-type H+-transporting ATPase subunit b|uniref:ATP synthase subunit b' n=1 Tax=Limnospira platensis NIES-46 TaxID=1236695 RepID=A0A5M3TCH1_LIMPL|nr:MULTISPECIES: F0F1 ATP synthase subunit B' [Arthrospira]MDF2211300.1 F0F1 ATP synthase subunit B' [Arthrospira platensis NCB002]MDT9181749.1 F0F1 ATP synthase subunit B' [Limnospira sp. PMC 289.06]MDT9296197.1 F0F1 ATP synthase subunit B' [Arthrospira platensis PCC 7345]BAI88666.1 ATP synthase b' chain [Arthrospira platensis NIES-39]TVU53668.1 MAG: F0F1 ATP synthase subunit B' [Arthrospira sp. PLM2.Bin9]